MMFSKIMTKNKAFVVPAIGLLVISLVIGLFLWNSSASVNIINTIAKNSVSGIKTLQGRD